MVKPKTCSVIRIRPFEAKTGRGDRAARGKTASADNLSGPLSQRRPPPARASKPQPLLSIREAAEILNMSEKSVSRRIQDGSLRASRIGGMWRIDPADLQDFIRDRRSW
jgi:excisionase family DNA binding protein